VFTARGHGVESERETGIAALRFSVRSLRSAFEKRSGAGRELERDFTTLRDDSPFLRAAVEKRSGPALSVENSARSRCSAIEKRSEPSLIIEIVGSHSHTYGSVTFYEFLKFPNSFRAVRTHS
jgi:hypothetical protein